jgi:hypothetical protein
MKKVMNFVLVALLAIPMVALTGCAGDSHSEPKDKLGERY